MLSKQLWRVESLYCYSLVSIQIYLFCSNIFYWLCYYSCPIFFFLLSPSTLHPPPTSIPPFSSCPWVVHISSLASPFPILFLTFPLCIFYLSFMLLIPCTFSPFLPTHSPTDNPPFLWFCSCSSCLLSLFLGGVFLGLVVDSCEFVVTLLFVFLIFFFFLDKSL